MVSSLFHSNLTHSFVVLLAIYVTSAALQNFTIDDTNGDERTGSFPLYIPQSAWVKGSVSLCGSLNSSVVAQNCLDVVDGSKAFHQTWHTCADGSQGATIQLDFEGEVFSNFS